MKKTLIIISILILTIIPFSYAASDFAFNRLYSDSQPIDGLNYSINVNSSEFWVTDSLGPLGDVSSQFRTFGDQTLYIDSDYIDANWCALTGCTMSGDLTFDNAAIQNPNYIQFNTSWTDGAEEGKLQWNTEDGTLEVGMPGGNVNLQIGQEMLSRSKNNKGSIIFDGQVVYISGAAGGNLLIDTPIATNITQATRTFAVATESIDNQQLGYVTTTGVVRGVNTNAWNAGDLLWLSETEEGNLTTTVPTAPNTKVAIGIVRKVAGDGEISVKPIVIPRLISLSDVYPIGLTDASIFRYNSTSQRFEISTSYTTDETDELIGGASLELYFKNTSSGISTYWDMNQSANGAPKNSSSILLSADSTQIGGFISPNASDMGISGLSNGIIDSHFHASVDLVSGKKSVNGYIEVYKRYSNGTEIFLTRSHLVEVDATSEQEYEAHASLFNEVTLNDSDRIVMKLFANLSGSGGNPTLTTYIQGDTLARGDFSSLGVHFATKADLENYWKAGDTTETRDYTTSGNVTANILSWGGGYITSNATCSYLRYNATDFLKESECP